MAEEDKTTDSTGDVIEIDLEEVIGNVLDSRGLTKDNVDRLSMLDSLEETIGGMFKANKPPKAEKFDSEGFAKTIGDIVDEKLRGIDFGGSKPKSKEPGFLSKWLGGTT